MQLDPLRLGAPWLALAFFTVSWQLPYPSPCCFSVVSFLLLFLIGCPNSTIFNCGFAAERRMFYYRFRKVLSSGGAHVSTPANSLRRSFKTRRTCCYKHPSSGLRLRRCDCVSSPPTLQRTAGRNPLPLLARDFLPGPSMPFDIRFSSAAAARRHPNNSIHISRVHRGVIQMLVFFLFTWSRLASSVPPHAVGVLSTHRSIPN